ncbi:MAG: hypothetical protein V2A65_04790 [Candidatus Omnitrophota bacterium]
MTEVKDKMWIWGHEAGSHNNQSNIQGLSWMTPVEGASYLGVPNVVMVRYGNRPAPPYDKDVKALSPLKRVVWSIVGAGGSHDKDDEISLICSLANRYPNICGVIMDDFFGGGEKEAALTPQDLAETQENLTVGNRKLDLWVVLYDNQLRLPSDAYLKECDIITFWTWKASNLNNLEQNFTEAEKIARRCNCRLVLGCYMYNYGEGTEMPVSMMEKQCQSGLKWLKEGRIEGMIFLASCICDLGLATVEWTRNWIKNL